MKKDYLVFDPRNGYPRGKDIFYECERCGDIIPSQPEDGIGCTCRNIFIDVDAGRVSVKEATKFSVFK
jgi:hypothetical protein